jgi:poly(hydroxyalkanoate) granule-associated protein
MISLKEVTMALKDDDKKPTDPIKDSAQQIWLAGLGAFAKAQQEGTKVFEALVKEGVGMQKKTQAAAEESFTQAQSRLAGMASELGARASGQWGKLENIFEDRVARALEKLGVPAAAEVAALKARVDALEAQLRGTPPGTGTVRPARKAATPARKAVEGERKPSRRRAA